MLWVDDRPENNATEIAAFARLQIEVCTRRSTGAAIDVLADAAEPFDLVISDWQRPAEKPSVPEGLRLLRAIRARAWTVPVIFYHGILARRIATRAMRIWRRRATRAECQVAGVQRPVTAPPGVSPRDPSRLPTA